MLPGLQVLVQRAARVPPVPVPPGQVLALPVLAQLGRAQLDLPLLQARPPRALQARAQAPPRTELLAQVSPPVPPPPPALPPRGLRERG